MGQVTSRASGPRAPLRRLRALRALRASASLAVALAATGTAGAATAAAQDAGAEDEPARLEPLEVAVGRMTSLLDQLSYAVSAVPLEESAVPGRAVSLAERLRGVPGVFVQDRRNFSLGDRITIRGAGARAQFGVRGVQVIVDDIPLTLPDGQSALGNLDLATAGRVELIRGPASALYGNAAGGVILVRTRPAAAVPLAMESEVAAASHGFLDARLEASGSAGRLGWLAGLRRVETNGFREHAEAEVWSANLVGRYDVSSATELGGVLNLFHIPFARNPSSLDRETARRSPRSVRPFIVAQGAGETNTQAQAGLSVRHRWGASSELSASVWGLRRSVRNPIPASIIDLSREAAGTRLALRGRRIAGGIPVRFVAGIDAAIQSDDRIERANEGLEAGEDRAEPGDLLLDQRERVLGIGPFTQLTVSPATKWSLTVAGRYDVNHFEAADRRLGDGDDSGSRTLSRFSPMVGMTFQLKPDLALYGNFATAFETPTTSELSNDPSREGGFNESLRPEVMRSFELGFRGRLSGGGLPGGGLSFGISTYRSTVDDALIPFQDATEEVFFRNAGRVSRDGVELELAWTPVPRIDLSLAYTFQDFILEEFVTGAGDLSGRREPGVPRHRLQVGLRGRLPAGLRAELDAEWVDAFPVDDANRFSNWSYAVIDVRASGEMRLGDLRPRPFIAVDNLLDERYNGSVVPNAFGDRYYEPAPGRELLVGVSLPLTKRGRD